MYLKQPSQTHIFLSDFLSFAMSFVEGLDLVLSTELERTGASCTEEPKAPPMDEEELVRS